MQWANNMLGIALSIEHDCLAMAANIADEPRSAALVYQGGRIVHPVQGAIVARIRDHARVAEVLRNPGEQVRLLQCIYFRMQIPIDRKLCEASLELFFV